MKRFLIFILLAAILGAGFGFYEYNRPHKGMDQMSTDFKINAKQLFLEFENNEAAANKKYLDKVIEVSGTITNITEDENGGRSITLESENIIFGVIGELDPSEKHSKITLQKGKEITMKGICSGMLSDVILVRCTII